ncbi:helix-turn-helix domain-containing protein [Pseudoalteromonas luteoviolacea]|uniref:GlxA family transcriptional regulator n=1 Tax=Pseudoalteromonas luteoviolacea TaxID=43657 RepID=UPI001B39C9F0|nr:helix-turn-helix domain-containing protein [Pseudoalteromonas luteoviolacea]MBQ4810550.1 helix-turn-helix domain-containing protein [Pseudoalteromonas luteoviolacea]
MKHIAIVAFDEISMFHLSVPLAVFADAIPDCDNYFSTTVCAERKGRVSVSGGLDLFVSHTFDELSNADIIIIPSWPPTKQIDVSLKEHLQHAKANNKLIVGLCLGAYALAYSGLLDGKRATTHWKFSHDFRQRFPDVDLDTNPLFVVHENIITSAGSAAAIDCCLHIVKSVYGVKFANQIARMMVSPPSRTGGQNQFIDSPVVHRPSDTRLAKLVDTFQGDLSTSLSVGQAANLCSMSVRSFTRHFKANYGTSFITWQILMRLNASLELLESSDASIATISETIGFSSEQVFRKHFKAQFDCSPQAWRRLFNNK